MNLPELTIKQAHEGLIRKEFSAQELTRACLIKAKKEDKKLFAFLTLSRGLALAQAKKVDEMIDRREEMPLLAGIPLAIKDNILVKGVRCTAGSKILENYIAPYDATVVKKLKASKAVILGKTNLDEFAMGSSTENSAFGPTKNPYDFERVPGGSSGGSAAAVAANLCLAGLGSDTGGSVRQPASFCGLVGLKPSYGAVSRYGLIAMASSLDQIGPITKTVEDAKIVFNIIKGKDSLDSTSVEPAKLQTTNYKLQTIKIGVPKEYFIKGMDEEVEKVVKKAIKQFESGGAKIEEIGLPHTKYALPTYHIVMPSEVSTNLARYDGIKYGYSTMNNEQRTMNNLLDVYLQSREEGFGQEVRRRIMLGTYALSAGYYDAYYLRAQKVRTLIKQDFEKAFNKVDVLMTPTSPFVAFRIGERVKNPLSMYLADVFTVSVNLAGLPALSLPCGRVQGLPVGLQIIGQAFAEDQILALGQAFEQMSE